MHDRSASSSPSWSEASSRSAVGVEVVVVQGHLQNARPIGEQQPVVWSEAGNRSTASAEVVVVLAI
jgi:hypothetical protein